MEKTSRRSNLGGPSECQWYGSSIATWEVRSTLPNSIARVMFTVHEGMIILLHGFIKKSRQTPKRDLVLALNRLKSLQSE